MSKKIIARGFTSFALLGLATATSFASDKRVYSGLVCNPSPASSGVMVRNNGTVYNSSATNALDVLCPIVRHNPGTAFGASQISFDVFDRNSTAGAIGNFQCQLCNEVGVTTGLSSACGSAAVTVPGFSQTGVKNLVETTGPSVLGSTEYSYAFCTIPPSSGGNFSHLARIYVNET